MSDSASPVRVPAGKPLVYVVDDDESSGAFLSASMEDAGYEVQLFHSAVDFLNHQYVAGGPACILLDNQMPGMTGLQLQAKLESRQPALPIIFISGQSSYDDVFAASMSGAVAYLQKPVDRSNLLQAVNKALEMSARTLQKVASSSDLQQRYGSLSEREKSVFLLLVQGKPNKVLAKELGIQLRTVEYHRSNVLKKLGVFMLQDLISIARELGLE